MKPSQQTGAWIFGCFIVMAAAGPFITGFTPFEIDGERLAPPSFDHWLGTNKLGQDLFSQLVYGARTTLFIGLAVSLISTALSALLGLAAGYSRRMDGFLNALANMLMVLPSMLLILITASFTGGGTWQLILTLGLLTWPGYMKLIRASVLSLKEREFVKAAQLYGGGSGYVMRRHLVPFILPLIRTKFIMSFKTAVAAEAGPSFLGIGDPNVPSWGKMLQNAFNDSSTFMTDAWQWTVLPPAAAVLLVTVSLALLGESGRSRGVKTAAPLGQQKSKAPSEQGQPALRNGQAAITLQDVTVTYGSQEILHSISLEVPAGNVTALVGESGSGKTTLARTIYGLLPSSAVQGKAVVAGKAVYQSGGRAGFQRWIDAAFIYQDPRASFDPLMKIGEQFYEAMYMAENKALKRKKAAKLLGEVQLEERVLDCYPHELSGGMLSRAMIALALVNEPKVLIADEPTGALDPLVKKEILELLIRKVREHHMTLLLITHDIPAAVHTADNILLLQDGRLADRTYTEKYLYRYGHSNHQTIPGKKLLAAEG